MGVITLAKRDYCYYTYGNYDDDCNTNWSTWGRWVLLVGIVVGILILFFLFSCITARRRRARGAAPYRGTGWMAPQHGAVNYYGPGGPNVQSAYPNAQYPPHGQYQTGYEQYNAGPPPPNYNAANAGYYGQETGMEMQPPRASYHPTAHGAGGQQVYAAPEGPPPGKGDGIVR